MVKSWLRWLRSHSEPLYSGRYISGISFYTSFDLPTKWSASVMVNTSVSGDLPRAVRARDFRAVF